MNPLAECACAWSRNVLVSLAVVVVSPVQAENYYVDREAGNNANSGLLGFPWQDMRKVNQFDFQPGDAVHLRRGQRWAGEKISLTESGSPGNPVTVTNYGPAEEPLPVIAGAAPLDQEVLGRWDFDIHTVNSGSRLDTFAGWGVGANSPNTVKADAETYLGSGVSAKLQDNGSNTARIWRRTPIAMAAGLPVAIRLRIKVESGDLSLTIKNLATGNYYSANGSWGAQAPAAVYSSASYGSWSEVALVVPNDAVLGQYEMEFRVNGAALVDEVDLSVPWVPHAPNVYKRAIMSDIVSGVFAVYHDETLIPKHAGTATFAQNFDWAVDSAQRVLYMYYTGSLAALNAEPLQADRAAYYAVDLVGTDLVIDGLHVEKSSTGIRANNDNLVIRNNLVQHIGRCGIHALKVIDNVNIPLYDVTTSDNVVRDSSCGIYYWHVHDSYISGNALSNLRDRGYGLDIEAMGLQSVTTTLVERNVATDSVTGIGLWGGPGAPGADNEFRYNMVHNVDYFGILLGGVADDHGVPGGPVRAYVYRNLVHHNILFNNGFGPGYELKGSGIRQNKTPRAEDGPNQWYNNVLYGNRFNFSGETHAGNFVFRNNISLAPAIGHLEFPGSENIYNDLAASELSHNLYYPDGPLFDWHGDYPSFMTYRDGNQKDLTVSQAADPMFVNPSINADAADFSLQTGSPAIDTGADVGLALDFAGNPVARLPDIGAFENLDADGDGFQYPDDCDDLNPDIHPGVIEQPQDGVDQDCQGGDSTIVVLLAVYSDKKGGELTVEALSAGGQNDTLTVLGFGAMQWSSKQSGRWILKQSDIGGNPGLIRIGGAEGTIEAPVAE